MLMSDIKPFCDKYGYTCSEDFGVVHIRTKFESWKFEETYSPKAKVKLLHHDAHGDGYHIQFRRNITPADLILYVHQHETAKYVHFVKYSMSKDGARLHNKSKSTTSGKRR